MAGFPTDLFLTLVGVTLLFTLARGNGTLDQVVRAALGVCRGNIGLIPIVFFGLSLGIASIGAGNIAAAALIAPLAMAVADRAKISPFLMTLMVGHGCIAGALSPIAPTGIIANGLMSRMGMSGFERQNYLYNLVANALAAGTAYLAFGGLRLFGQRHAEERSVTGRLSSGCGDEHETLDHAGSHRGSGDRCDRLSRPCRDGGIRGGGITHAGQGHRREARDPVNTLGRDRDGLRRDGPDIICWRRREESICSRRSWRGSRRNAPSRA